MMLEAEEIKDIDKALNGYEAFTKFIQKNYDLVISDLNMPVMNGY